MINVWDYVNAKRITITDANGKEYTGDVVCVMDTDENGRDEDDISIQVSKDVVIGFLQSEIEKIEIVK